MNLLLQILLLIGFFNLDYAHAESKRGFPEIDSGDFKHFINTRDLPDKPSLYLYSSSSIERNIKEETSYSITNREIPMLSPASELSIFPEISTQTRSEYFDFTIWGHLGNYFNQSAEIVELESRVLEIFKTIEGVNKKYRELRPSFSSRGFNKRYTITADRYNYFSVIPSGSKEESGGGEKRASSAHSTGGRAKTEEKLTSKKGKLLKFHSLNPSQIKLNETMLIRHSENLKEETLLADTGIREELLISSTQTLRQVDSDSETLIDKVIYFFTKAPGYIKDNPLESSIYLMFIYFFFKVLTMIFLRR